MSSEQHCNYRIPGEYTLDGVTFCMRHKKETLEQFRSGTSPHFDILVATPQRAGTARLMEIIWLLSHNCDFETSNAIQSNDRHLFLDLLPPDFNLRKEKSALLNSPPVLGKTHLPYSWVRDVLEAKKDAKVVVGFRNLKDCLVSNYHFYRMNAGFGNFTGSWDEFFDIYKQGRLCYGCPLDMMSEWWNQRKNENVLIVHYEDFNTKGTFQIVSQIASFLGYEYDAKSIQAVADRVSFTSMRENPKLNYSGSIALKAEISPYMRKGQVGDWKNYFTEEQNAFVEKKISDRCIQEGLSLTYM